MHAPHCCWKQLMMPANHKKVRVGQILGFFCIQLVVSIFSSIIPIYTLYTIVVSIFFSIIPYITTLYKTARHVLVCCLAAFPVPLKAHGNINPAGPFEHLLNSCLCVPRCAFGAGCLQETGLDLGSCPMRMTTGLWQHGCRSHFWSACGYTSATPSFSRVL